MSEIEKRLESLGIKLPEVSKPVASYAPYVVFGNFVFVSGNLPFEGGELKIKGKLGEQVSLEEGIKAARICAINALASLKSAVGNLDKVNRILRVEGFVASTPDFDQHPKVVNGASELVVQVFGERGTHSRFAVGCASLPLGAPVEIGLIAGLK